MPKQTVEQRLEAKYTRTKVIPQWVLPKGQYGLRVFGNRKQIYMVQHEDTLVRRATYQEMVAWLKMLQYQNMFDSLLQKKQITSRHIDTDGNYIGGF